MTTFSKIMVAAIMVLSVAGLMVLAAPVLWKKDKLPVLGEPDHVAGDFSLLNQDGRPITAKDVAGKITVVEYFFTTCKGICPIMNKNLSRVYETFKSNDRVMILSHTVDPEHDSVPVMKAYAKQFGDDPAHWQFLTGSKEELYGLARHDYLLAVEDSTTAASRDEEFIHTEFVALVDPDRKIRGFYNATDEKSIEKLVKDIRTLLKD